MTKIFPYFLALLFLSVSSFVHAACTVIDDAGHSIHLAKPAARIISLAPDITETLFAIGAGHQVVAVIGGSDYPSAARSLPSVGSYSGVDLEKIVALHPDLIVTWSYAFARQLAALKTFGIAVYTTKPQQLEDIPRTMKNLGCLAGAEKSANQAAEQFAARLARLRRNYQAKKEITVFYQIGSYSLMTINKDSWINQAITLCGGRNLFAGSKTIAPEVSWEAVISANPQVIINSAADETWQARWQKWPEITAVKNHLLFSIHPDLIERAGPRVLDGVQQICLSLQQARELLM